MAFLKLGKDYGSKAQYLPSASARTGIPGSLYWLSDSNSLVVDNGTSLGNFFAPTPGTAINAKQPPYNAKGDGSTDDTSAISSAITAAINAGLDLFIPPGHYLLSPGTPFSPSNLTIYGVRGQTILDCRNAGGYLFEFSSTASNVRWYDLVFTTPDTTSGAASAAIFWNAACSDMEIDHCDFSNFSNYAIRINPGTNGANTGKRFRITNNTFTNIYQKRTTSPLNTVCADDSLIGWNYIYNCGVGGVASLAPIAWLPSHAYAVDDQVTNGGNVYYCATAGTSASSGGPTGTGSAINDGTAQWSWTTTLGIGSSFQHAIYQSGGGKGLRIVGNVANAAGGIVCGVTSGPLSFTDCIITQNSVINCPVNTPTFVVGPAMTGFVLTQNLVQASGGGVQVLVQNGANDGIISQNILDQNNLDSVTGLQIGFAAFGPDNIKVSDNMFINPVSASTASTGVLVIGASNVSITDNDFLDLAYSVLLNTSTSDTVRVGHNYAKRSTGNGNFQFFSLLSSARGSTNLFIRDNDVNGGHLLDIEGYCTNLLVTHNTSINAFSQNPIVDNLGGSFTNVTIKDNWFDAYGVQTPTGTGINIYNNGPLSDSAIDSPSQQTGITAYAGGGQGSATQLTATVCVVATCATIHDSVVLSNSTQASKHQLVINNGAASVDIYPPSGSSIDALGSNNPYTLASGSSREFYKTSATTWVSR